MTNKQKEKLTMDRYGLMVLGTSLLLQRKRMLFNSSKKPAHSDKVGESNASSFPFLPKPRNKNISRQNEIKFLETQLCALTQPCALKDINKAYKEAELVRFSSFKFEWFHLYDHRVLAVYCKPKLTASAIAVNTYDAEQIIAGRTFVGTVDSAMYEIFMDEVTKLLNFRCPVDDDNDEYFNEYYRENYARYPRGDDELFFSLLVSDFCNAQYRIDRGPEKGVSKNKKALDRILPLAERLVSEDFSYRGKPSKLGAVKEAQRDLRAGAVGLP